MVDENPSKKIFKYIKNKNIYLNKKKFDYKLKSHPEYPNIISIVDTLNAFDIQHDIYEATLKNIDHSVGSFLTFLNTNDSNLNLSFIEIINDGLYKIDSKIVSYDVLVSYFRNIIIVIGENKNLKRKRSQKVSLYHIYGVLIFLLPLYSSNFDLIILGFYFLSILGFIFSLYILKDIFGFNNSF